MRLRLITALIGPKRSARSGKHKSLPSVDSSKTEKSAGKVVLIVFFGVDVKVLPLLQLMPRKATINGKVMPAR